jgi:serine/threonine protein phosphatase 1
LSDACSPSRPEKLSRRIQGKFFDPVRADTAICFKCDATEQIFVNRAAAVCDKRSNFMALVSRAKRARPQVAPGTRIYAVGDVHGRADLLAGAFARIDADLRANPAQHAVEVLLGDYVDRGPQSREVIEQLIARGAGRETVCLRGNHEAFMLEFLNNPAVLPEWQRYGGLATLISYGLRPAMNPDEGQRAALASAFRRALPPAHLAFLRGLKPTFTCGDFFFVHAGVRPGVAFAKQQESDLLWIREDFLLHEERFEKIVVHGHTPVAEPDVRENRINIDTGAYATNKLTCLVLEGDTLRFV